MTVKAIGYAMPLDCYAMPLDGYAMPLDGYAMTLDGYIMHWMAMHHARWIHNLYNAISSHTAYGRGFQPGGRDTPGVGTFQGGHE